MHGSTPRCCVALYVSGNKGNSSAFACQTPKSSDHALSETQVAVHLLSQHAERWQDQLLSCTCCQWPRWAPTLHDAGSTYPCAAHTPVGMAPNGLRLTCC